MELVVPIFCRLPATYLRFAEERLVYPELPLAALWPHGQGSDPFAAARTQARTEWVLMSSQQRPLPLYQSPCGGRLFGFDHR